MPATGRGKKREPRDLAIRVEYHDAPPSAERLAAGIRFWEALLIPVIRDTSREPKQT